MAQTLYILVNISDPYTFYAPTLELAGLTAYMLSPTYGAKPAFGAGPATPVLWNWEDWMEERGIHAHFIRSNLARVADAMDTVLLGSASDRPGLERILERLPTHEQHAWKLQDHDNRRTSANDIGRHAWDLARYFRKEVARLDRLNAGLR